MLKYLVTDPRFFISHRTKYRGSKTQVYLAILVGVAFALQHVVLYYRLEDQVAVDYNEVILLSVTIDLLVPLALWVVATFAVAVVARLLVGPLTIGNLFRLGGWALAPLLVAGLIQSAGRVYALRDVEAPELGIFSHLSVEWEAYREFLDVASGDPAFVLATLVAAAFVLYAGYIWTLVVEELGTFDKIEVETWQAVVLAAIPTAIWLGYVLVSYLP